MEKSSVYYGNKGHLARSSWALGAGEGSILMAPGWAPGSRREHAADALVERADEDRRPLFSH